MSSDDLERFETEVELSLYREYRQVVDQYRFVVETERRFYLANDVDLKTRSGENGEVFFELDLADAWVWDMYRPQRKVERVRVLTFKDVNVERVSGAAASEV